MKVYIGPYKRFIGPYQIADAIFFWVPDYEEEGKESRSGKIRDKLAHFLTHGFHEKKRLKDTDGPVEAGQFFNAIQEQIGTTHYTWFFNLLQWIDNKRKRKVKVKIDRYDTWDAHHTLALIALPLMKKFKEEKNGSCLVDIEDVPEHLQLSTHNEWGWEPQLCFDFYTETSSNNFIHERFDWVLDEVIWALEQIDDDSWENQYHGDEFDAQKYVQHNERIDNGLRMFGKYFRGFWR